MVNLFKTLSLVVLLIAYINATVYKKNILKKSNEKKSRSLMGYFGTQSQTELAARINVTQISSKLSHVFFAFVEVDGERSECKILDPIQDINDVSDPKLKQLNSKTQCDVDKQAKGNLGALFAHKVLNPHQKTLMSVGGASAERSKNFTLATSTLERSQKLAKSCVRLALDYGFDGIDFDWESPTNALEWKQYTDLIVETKKAFESFKDGKDYIVSLTVLMPVFKEHSDESFSVVKDHVNFINLMTYDSSKDSDGALHHSALYGAPETYDVPYINSTVTAALKYFPPSKIIVGQPLYGYEVQVKIGSSTSPTAPGPGIYERVDRANRSTMMHGLDTKTLMYNQIQKDYLTNKDYVRYWDDKSKANYLFNNKTSKFVTYVDQRALQNVVDYIEHMDLGGMFFWQLGGSFNHETNTEELIEFVATKMTLDTTPNKICANHSPFCNIKTECKPEDLKVNTAKHTESNKNKLVDSNASKFKVDSWSLILLVVQLVLLMH